MAYDLGWAALNLEMPDRVPRTEYSLAEYHFPLIKAGIRIPANTPVENCLIYEEAYREMCRR